MNCDYHSEGHMHKGGGSQKKQTALIEFIESYSWRCDLEEI